MEDDPVVCEKGARATGSPPCTYCHTYILPYIHTYCHTYMHTAIHAYCHTYILLYIRTAIHTSVLLLTTQQLYSDFRGFNNGVCNVIRITITESNPAMELLAQQTFCFRPNILPGKQTKKKRKKRQLNDCLLYTSPSPRDTI